MPSINDCYHYLYYHIEPPTDNYEELYLELKRYTNSDNRRASLTKCLNRVSSEGYTNNFTSWLIENKEEELIELCKITKYVFYDSTRYVSEYECYQFYEDKPVDNVVLSYLNIGIYNYVTIGTKQYYYKKGDLLHYSLIERVFGSDTLFNIIHYGVECDECGHIHFESDCPKCAAFTKINSYGTQVQDLLSDAVTDKEYGIEIEIEGAPTHNNNFVKGVTEIEHKYLLCKSDGSLRTGGVELVTKPASMAEHLQRMPKVLESIDYVTSVRTGMHVHVNRELVNVNLLLNLFVDQKFWNVIEKFSGRGKGYHKNRPYAKFNRSLNPPRNSCFNITTGTKGTVEFRMFAAPKNIKLFKRHMEFVKSCVDFSQEYNYRQGYDGLADKYISYVKEKSDTYKLLAEKFKRHKWFETIQETQETQGIESNFYVLDPARLALPDVPF